MSNGNTGIRHGTYAGYQAHRKFGEEVCEDCHAANSDYRREYRRNRPATVAYDRAQAAAYARAEKRLRKLHYVEFNALYHEELVRAGLRTETEELA